MQIKTLSASSIELYETCPWCWKAQYVDKLMGIPSKALDIGKYVHDGLRNFHTKRPILDEIKAKLLLTSNKENIETFGKIRRMVESYIQFYNKAKPNDPIKQRSLTVEEKFKYPIRNSKGKEVGVDIIGLMDRTTDTGIIEYKTTSEPYTQERVDTSFQATIYSYAYKMMKKRDGIVNFVVFNKNEKNQDHIINSFQTSRTAQQLDEMFDKCYEIKSKIDNDMFEPNYDDDKGHKYWSQFRDLCPACTGHKVNQELL